MIEKPVAWETGYTLVFPNGKHFARNGKKTRIESYAEWFSKLKYAAKEMESYDERLGLRCIQKTLVVLPDFDTDVQDEWRMPDTEERIVYVIGNDGEHPAFLHPSECRYSTSSSRAIIGASLFSLSEAEELREQIGGKVYKTIIFEKEVQTS